MMFHWLAKKHGDPEALAIANKIRRATEGVLVEGKCGTPDPGGGGEEYRPGDGGRDCAETCLQLRPRDSREKERSPRAR